ncbi:MAG TPA: patatin-like phospholipase family protein [Accumulibacter sp.]|jgi:NTE family protein|nr:patatin-like phospholipase family protein [Accumulibacter sp.]
MVKKKRIALILSGGGARAAYQVGVLLAIRELLGNPVGNPFAILCGTSAGAINAATLACYSHNFAAAVEALTGVWRNMRAGQIYRADPLGMCLSGIRWLGALLFGWIVKYSPRSILDNRPLRKLLENALDFSTIQHSLDNGSLYAVSITASGYATGDSVSFYQAHPEIKSWRRAHRVGCRTTLSVDHLMASSAIPFVFPALYLNREFFGDGSMRQLAPISPAIHLGAEKVLIVGVAQLAEPLRRQSSTTYPSLAQIAGHAMASIFLDSLGSDIERMERINRTLSKVPSELRDGGDISLRPVQSLTIAPSERLEPLAAQHVHSLPWAVKILLRGLGAMSRRGSALASYLLFEKPYTDALINLGHKDAMAMRTEIEAFFRADHT